MKDVTLQLAQLKELCVVILTWSKYGKMNTPYPNRPAKETEFDAQRTGSKYLNQMDPNAFAAASQMMKPSCTFTVSLIKWSNQMWVATDRMRPVVLLWPDFQISKRLFSSFFFFLSQHTGSSHGCHSTTEVNTHCNILSWNCSTGSDKINTSAAPNRWHQ